MRTRHRRVVAALVLAALSLLPACRRTSATPGAGRAPATVERVEGTNLSRVTLSARAAERLGIQTVPVRELPASGGGSPEMVIPYAAVLYDQAGRAWAYASPSPLTFVRSPLSIDRIEGADAVLSFGPPLGAAVVTVGAAELFGAEYGVGEA